MLSSLSQSESLYVLYIYLNLQSNAANLDIPSSTTNFSVFPLRQIGMKGVQRIG